MSLKSYPVYKDSGVEWLGQVPETWVVTRVQDIAQLINGFPFDSSRFGFTGHPLIRIRDLNAAHTEKQYDGEVVPQALVDNTDLLVGMDGDFNVGRWLGDGSALLNQRVLAIRSSHHLSKWLHYSLPTPLKIINDLTYATTVKHLSSQQVAQIRIAFPFSDLELASITSYLDSETAEIDAFIEDQEELIALLRERRAATVSAMTFSCSAESGEPSVFPFVRIGQVISESDDRVESARTEDLLSVSIHSGVSPWRDLHDKEPRSESLRNYKIVQPGDIVLNRMRAFQGGLGEARIPGVVSPDYMVMHARHSADSKYLAYLMKSQRFVAEMSSRLRGIGSEEQGAVRTPRINPKDLLNIRVPLPPIDEQRQIVTYIDHEIAEIDAAIIDAREAIALSKERRAAVISAAVTGKIDVREVPLLTSTRKMGAESVGVA